jgi:hypothetical protein
MTKAMETTSDISTIIKGAHENKWVAITADYSRVLAAADSLRELMRSVTDPDVIFYRVLPLNVTFAPTSY